MTKYLLVVLVLASCISPGAQAQDAESVFKLALRTAVKNADGSFTRSQSRREWDPAKTAVIVCDMWDAHHCLNATKRGAEVAPRMNAFLKESRKRGATIIHAPSSCVDFYKDHPARKRVADVPKAKNLPAKINDWLNWRNAEEEAAGYPIDHSDGGEDDDPKEHAEWAKELENRGRNPGAPWVRQSEALEIDGGKDFITDNGTENWSILELKGIENVLLVGVHTNMCVLGRPFGLRQMANNGKNVALVRDLTDTMYNPKMKPFVSHFRGTDLIIDHVEKYVCPTVSSEQVLGGSAHSFKGDDRKHLVIVTAEREYKTEVTLPAFADAHLANDFRISYVHADPDDKNDLIGIEALADADIALISVRRRTLAEHQLDFVRKFVAAGKPVVGIRTASHAFSLREKPAPDGHASWDSFDADVWGGSYHGHLGNKLKTSAWVRKGAQKHPILKGIKEAEFSTGGSLYQVLPLAAGAEVLVMGKAETAPDREPVAWTFKHSGGGRAFYTSLGHVDDFSNPQFTQMLVNAVYWGLAMEVSDASVTTPSPEGGEIAKISRVVKKAVNEGRENPLDPLQSFSHITVGEGLEADLVLHEPLVTQPLHLSFDERGRLWVVEYMQYPDPAGLKRVSRDAVWRITYEKMPPPPPHAEGSPFRGKDRISIHEDTDGDGVFDSHKIFADHLNLATSVARGRGGVWVTQPPYLLFYPDRDNDDVPDSDPEVHLKGFMLEDTHSIANSLYWGPDGWLYGTQGSTVSANITRPGLDADDDGVKTMGQNVWRYHPERRVYEVFAEGGGNAFGVEIDSGGRVFSGHNGGDTRGFHYQQGAYLRKGFNKHGDLTNPYSFGYFPHMLHHKVARFTHQFLIYEENRLPERYQGKLWGVDVMHSNVVMSDISDDGSTFKTRDISRPFDSTDKWVRPVHIATGPNGWLYVADWYDAQVNHYRNHEGQIDQKRGRVYRIREKGGLARPSSNLAALTDAQLVELLFDERRWYRQTALRLLGDRKLKRPTVRALWKRVGESSGQEAVESLWAVHQAGALNDVRTLSALGHPNPLVRKWAVQLAGDNKVVSAKVGARMAGLALTDPNVEVRAQLASTAKRLGSLHGLAIAANLLRRSEDVADPRLPLLTWWAIEAKAAENPDDVVGVFQNRQVWELPIVREHILWRVMKRFALSGTREDLGRCGQLLALAPEDGATEALMKGFEEAFQGRSMTNLPAALSEQLARLGGDRALVVRLRQGETEAINTALKRIGDPEASKILRARLIGIFGDIVSPAALALLLEVFTSEEEGALRAEALGALHRYRDPRVTAQVIADYTKLPDGLQTSARSLLTATPSRSRALIAAIAAGRIKGDDFSLAEVRKLAAHGNAEIDVFVDKRWGRLLKASTEEKETEIGRVKAVLEAAEGVPKKGETIFAQRCVGCHLMFGKGGRIGPDLTSYQRTDLDSMLLGVIAPSAEIREGYENSVVKTKDGSVYTGFLVDQDNQVVVLRDVAGQNQLIKRLIIESTEVIGTSLMPEGLLGGLSDQELRDFFAYLRSTTPPF